VRLPAKANQTAPRSLIDKLMQVLGQEQKQVREEIEERIRRHVRDIEKKGFDPPSHSSTTQLNLILKSSRLTFPAETGLNCWRDQGQDY